MKLSDFKLGMKVVKVGGAAQKSTAIVTKLEPNRVTVKILTTTHSQFMDKGDEYAIRSAPFNWQPVVITQFRNK